MCAEFVVREVRRQRFHLSNEKGTQVQIENLLAAQAFRREYRLNAQDVPDFFDEATGLAIEVKLRGSSKAQIYRQLKRYADHPKVRAILLLTNVSMGLPREIGGKPAFYVSLGRAWV